MVCLYTPGLELRVIIAFISTQALISSLLQFIEETPTHSCCHAATTYGARHKFWTPHDWAVILALLAGPHNCRPPAAAPLLLLLMLLLVPALPKCLPKSSPHRRLPRCPANAGVRGCRCSCCPRLASALPGRWSTLLNPGRCRSAARSGTSAACVVIATPLCAQTLLQHSR